MHMSRMVSFSGIDGAGKSSQIDHLKAVFEQKGRQVRVIAFWDSIATLKKLRESAGHSIFKGDRGVGSPSAPINRRDKNVRSFPMTLARLVMYLLDAVSNRTAVNRARRSEADLVIFDRYIYDELANLRLRSPMIRLYARVLLKMVPSPDIAFLLDASPSEARARKPEYPLEFLVENRDSYLDLAKLSSRLTVLPALSIDRVSAIVTDHAMKLDSGSLGMQTASSDYPIAIPTQP
jgi:thymidylate kinase